MLKWLRQWRIDSLLVELAYLNGYLDAWGNREYLEARKYGRRAQIIQILHHYGVEVQNG